jgi:hypothetical protein
MPSHSSEIQQTYRQAIESDTLGGSRIWYDLARVSWKCVSEVYEPDKKAVAYGLYHLFDSLARGTDEQIVFTDRMKMFIEQAQDVLLSSINFLDEPSDDTQAVALLVNIAELELNGFR